MPDKSFWSDDWMALQRGYWDQWTKMQQQALSAVGAGTPPDNPWQSALDHWWQAVSAGVPGMSRDFLEKVMDQGKSFFSLVLAGSSSRDHNQRGNKTSSDQY